MRKSIFIAMAGAVLLAGCAARPNVSEPFLPAADSDIIARKDIQEADLPATVKTASAPFRADGNVSHFQVIYRKDGHVEYRFIMEREGSRNYLSYLETGSQVEDRFELTPLPLTPLPADLTLADARVATYGRLDLLVFAKDQPLALAVYCNLPKLIDRTMVRTLGGDVGANLALTSRAIRSLWPGGAAPPAALPSEYQRATGGTIEIEPTNVPMQVKVTLRNVQFPGTQLKTFGPVTVMLDNPFPP